MRRAWRNLITKDNVRKVVLKGGKIIIAFCAAAIANELTPERVSFAFMPGIKEDGESDIEVSEGYAEVINVIACSSMSSYYKNSAMEAVPRNGSVELYRAIINIVRSNMSDYYKVSAIEDMC